MKFYSKNDFLVLNKASLRPQGGSEGQKLSKVILQDLVEMKTNIIAGPSYDFLKIGFACNYITQKTLNRDAQYGGHIGFFNYFGL